MSQMTPIPVNRPLQQMRIEPFCRNGFQLSPGRLPISQCHCRSLIRLPNIEQQLSWSLTMSLLFLHPLFQTYHCSESRTSAKELMITWKRQQLSNSREGGAPLAQSPFFQFQKLQQEATTAALLRCGECRVMVVC